MSNIFYAIKENVMQFQGLDFRMLWGVLECTYLSLPLSKPSIMLELDCESFFLREVFIF